MTDLRQSGCYGYCRDCGVEHVLGMGKAKEHARELMTEFEQIGRLDYLASEAEANPRLAFDHLFSPGRGHMFGVMECVDTEGNSVVLRAFSSLYEGIRDVDGWVPPLLSSDVHATVYKPGETRIKAMTDEMDLMHPKSPEFAEFADSRRRMSQELFRKLQGHYEFVNFRGETRSLFDVWTGDGGIPGGVGECCAPRLLNHAARNNLRPLGIAEFYWGGSNKSDTRRQGEFYPACETRCRPILGFMLCGLE
jgi:hypothetical protein